MSQSGIIAGALLAAFIFWLAVNNRLTTYAAVLWGPTAAPKPSGGTTSSDSSSGGLPGIGDIANLGKNVGAASTALDILGAL